MSIDFSITPEQEQIRALAHDFAARRMRPQAAHFDETEEFPWDLVREAHQLDLTPTVLMPVELGGGGLDAVTYMLVLEELHWGCAGIASAIAASGLSALILRAVANEEQQRRWLAPLCAKEPFRLSATAWTEPFGGSDLLNLSTKAERSGDGYVLNGTKVFVTNGGIADVHVVFANSGSGAGAAGISVFVVEKGMPGLILARKERKLGVRASHTAQLIFEDCFVPAANRLGGDAPGVAALAGLMALEQSRPLVAAGAIGIARAAYEAALEHARNRVISGQPLIQHQAIGFKLADMAMEIDAARLLTWRAGWMADRGVFFRGGESNMAKAYAADMAVQVTLEAMQVLGGYGYMSDSPLQKWLRDAKIYQIWEGTSEIQRLLIANAIGRPQPARRERPRAGAAAR